MLLTHFHANATTCASKLSLQSWPRVNGWHAYLFHYYLYILQILSFLFRERKQNDNYNNNNNKKRSLKYLIPLINFISFAIANIKIYKFHTNAYWVNFVFISICWKIVYHACAPMHRLCWFMLFSNKQQWLADSDFCCTNNFSNSCDLAFYLLLASSAVYILLFV